MYCVGDYVVYSNSGVCRVTAVGVPDCARVDQTRDYYTLTPVYDTETLYVPVDTTAPIRPALTKAQAQALIAGMPAIQEEQLDTRSMQALAEYYRTSFQSQDCEGLVRLLKTIHGKDLRAQQNGGKPGKVDQRYRKRAEDLLHGELAVALEIPREQVLDYIQSCLEEDSLETAQ